MMLVIVFAPTLNYHPACLGCSHPPLGWSDTEDTRQPLHPYWVRQWEDGRIEPLRAARGGGLQNTGANPWKPQEAPGGRLRRARDHDVGFLLTWEWRREDALQMGTEGVALKLNRKYIGW